jgi:hypothetical protein
MIFLKRNKIKTRFFLFIGIFLLFSFASAKSQQYGSSVKQDTLHLKEGSTLIINKQKIKIKSDTSIIISSGTKYEIELSKNELFYNKLKKKAKNNFWTRELHDIIVADSRLNKSDSFKTIHSTQPFNDCRKRPIRHIIINQLPVFGPTISDTLSKPTSFFERTANKLHFQTKKFLIQKNLLFSEKDLVNPEILADNERVLRSLPYIDDSKIEIQPLGNNNDSVDIIVIVKDNWSMAFDVKIEKLQTGQIDFMNKNILGLGQEMQNSALWDKRKRPGTGYEGTYIIRNIGGSFFNGNVIYNKSFGDQTLTLKLNRDFFTPNIKYAGGASFKNVKSDIRYFFVVPSVFFPIEYNEFETWMGRSFLLTSQNTNRTRQNLTFAGKIIFDRYYERPKVTETSYYNLQNKTLFLFSVIYTQQDFFKSNLIYNFGRAEDIPVGGELSLTGGYEINEFTNRRYLSGKFAIGKFIGPFGYISTGISLGTFFNKDKTEQGILTSNLNYFSNLFVVNRFKFRHFLTLNLTQGINRFFREFITMNNKQGISGYYNDSIYGNQRFNLKWETDCFTPWKFYDFKFVLFTYADLTWLGQQNQRIFYGSPYSGFGFGIRLRNERLVFNTIQLRFSFYPFIPPNSRYSFIKLSGEPVLSPDDFSPKAPSLIEFR